MIEIVCIHCGNLYGAPRKGVKFCSPICRDRWHSTKNKVKKAERSRLYGYAKYGHRPRATLPIACPVCASNFVPFQRRQACCSKQCAARMRYHRDPEKYRAKTRQGHAKYQELHKARGRMTWAEMKAQRGLGSHYAKSRYPWLPLLSGARHRARKFGLPFDLDREWCEARWTGRCELTEIQFLLNTEIRGGFAPSIDKIVPEQGYIKSNCRFVLFAVNCLKHNGTDTEMYRVADALVSSQVSLASMLALPS